MIEFTEKDKEQLRKMGIDEKKASAQIETFKEGIPFVNLVSAAVVGNGIHKFSEEKKKDLIYFYEERIPNLSLLKFVPASGAASRMFKALFNFLDVYDPDKESLNEYIERTGDASIKEFANGLEKFPFYDIVMERIGSDFKSEGAKVYRFVTELLGENKLNYGFYPKGLLPFHKYPSGTATPFVEHLMEGALYASSESVSNLHFTISEQHEKMFRNEQEIVQPVVAKETNTRFYIDYSFQKPSTDTIAVDMDNRPFRNSDGSILFRPGGHGALIENLNEQDADLIFIKNIDNVSVNRDASEVAKSKMELAGTLLKAQGHAFDFAKVLDDEQLDDLQMEEIVGFLKDTLNASLPENYYELSNDEKVETLKSSLNRPIRVCGMVKNEGEPGGGPFWVKNEDGTVSLQIIESAQIDSDNADQVAILNSATHFNPVDIVCGVRNYKGEKYNLLDFVDYKQGFITEKTSEGKPLKALELPGLWNGAMANWNTIFVEVPLITFNPVKTVNDLLKPSHQVQ